MEQKKIDRINELAKKKKSDEGLTPEEESERDAMHKEYIAEYRAHVTKILDNTVVQYPDGSREKLNKKNK